jgi:Cu-processing system ATP-binding protein
MTANTVEIQGVGKRYGTTEAVRDVTVGFGEGECVALVGHNGAGKTTLIKLMLGLTRPTAGTLRVLGHDPLSRAGAIARVAIGYLPENVVFAPSPTGAEMLRFYARLKRRPRHECDELLARVGLAQAARKRIGTYSKGMRQRLGLAQALLGAPRILILDEPTTGLDPVARQAFYGIIAGLRDRGVTVVLSSHSLSELETRVDRIVVMYDGAIIANGTLEALRAAAHLPLRVRLRLKNGAAALAPGYFNGLAVAIEAPDGSVELSCAPDEKIEVLRRASRFDGVEDIEILQPTLDRLYAQLLEGREGRQ